LRHTSINPPGGADRPGAPAGARIDPRGSLPAGNNTPQRGQRASAVSSAS